MKFSILLALASSSVALAQSELKPLLEKGPLVLVEETSSGKFAQATAITEISAPPERVFATITDTGKFTQFMPKVTTSEVTKTEGKPNEYDVHTVLDVPGPDTDYVTHWTADPQKLEVVGRWKSGDLKDSTWLWKMERTREGTTLLSYTVSIRNFSSLLQNIEDSSQTMTVGVNVSSALAAAKAIKKRSESAR